MFSPNETVLASHFISPLPVLVNGIYNGKCMVEVKGSSMIGKLILDVDVTADMFVIMNFSLYRTQEYYITSISIVNDLKNFIGYPISNLLDK